MVRVAALYVAIVAAARPTGKRGNGSAAVGSVSALAIDYFFKEMTCGTENILKGTNAIAV